PTAKFMESVVENKQALDRILPGAIFRTFAYPKSGAKLSIKFYLEKHFICCRGGGQIPNVGTADLNLLKACFLAKREKIDINFIRDLINYNASCHGWLVFATHDVTDNPSPYGCTPEFFAEVVEYAVRSCSLLLPLGEAYDKLIGANNNKLCLN